MSVQRRSRMRRTPSGKSLSITARDLAIFRLLVRYRYLRSTYLHAFVGGASVNRFKERLGDLYHEGFIDRPAKQWEFAPARLLPALYEIAARAKGALSDSASLEKGAHTFLSAAEHRQFLHSVLICECLASIELATFRLPAVRYISWSEILARAPEGTRVSPIPHRLPASSAVTVTPDGLFGLEYQSHGRKAYRFFALEADRGTMPIARSNTDQTSYLGKLEAYREIIAKRVCKTHLAIPNLVVLTITTADKRLGEIVQRFEAQGGGAAFLFKAVAEADLKSPAAHLLLMPWCRAGLPPLRIDREAE